MKKLVSLFIVAVIFFLPGTSTAAMEIKLGVVTKPGSAQNIVAERFKQLIEQRSNGSMEVKIFHSGSIGNETQILHQIQSNKIQMGVITCGPFDAFDPIVRVINYPFVFRNSAEADRVLDGPLGAQILDSLEGAGFKGLSFSENGFRHLTNNRRPVKGMEDIQGLKIRVMASKLHETIWACLGADPVPIPWPIYTELEKGSVDGQENPLWVMDVYKFYQVQKYMTLTHHVYSPHIDVASLQWWKTLDRETRASIQTAMYEAAVFQREDNRAKDAARLRFLKEQGMVVEEDPDLDQLRAAVAGLKDDDLYKESKVQRLLVEMLAATR